MTDRILPRYPIYIPSKGRYKSGHTIKMLLRDNVPFYIVVEAQEADEYGSRYGYDNLLILPWQGDDKIRRKFTADRNIENGGLIAVRNWIKEHSITNGDERHWQLDDNIRHMYRRWRAKRIYCNAGIALAVTEDFVDRYENVAIAGLNYKMFLTDGARYKPFTVNQHVYSCSLILNSIPYRWRLRYNDDTDICLQVLANGWCTILMNTFCCDKITTMVVKGGNTDDLYQDDGRLKMSRSLERMWPGVVRTGRRYKRPQHFIKYEWTRFDTPLKLKPGIDLTNMKSDEYNMQLIQTTKEIKSSNLRKLYKEYNGKTK